MTTEGYGDLVPVTHTGRLLALLLMTFGIGLFAVLTSFVASRVVRLRADPEAIIATMQEENAMIRAELAEIRALLERRDGLEDE